MIVLGISDWLTQWHVSLVSFLPFFDNCPHIGPQEIV